ncbi:hypothetical protein ACHZ98_35160 [Streptomyces sp. MAR4 CNY-716]
MTAAHRRATLRLLTVAAFGALVLTGCGENGQETANGPAAVAAKDTEPSGGGEGAAAPDEGEDSPDEQPSTGRAPWAGTKQFVTIEEAWREGGLTHLSVRPAQKKANTQFDTWEIIPGKGAFTTVTMVKDARVLLTTPVRGDDATGVSRGEPLPSSQTEFVTLLKQLDSGLSAGIGYDLSFDGEGQVTRLQSQYRP